MCRKAEISEEKNDIWVFFHLKLICIHFDHYEGMIMQKRTHIMIFTYEIENYFNEITRRISCTSDPWHWERKIFSSVGNLNFNQNWRNLCLNVLWNVFEGLKLEFYDLRHTLISWNYFQLSKIEFQKVEK